MEKTTYITYLNWFNICKVTKNIICAYSLSLKHSAWQKIRQKIVPSFWILAAPTNEKQPEYYFAWSNSSNFSFKIHEKPCIFFPLFNIYPVQLKLDTTTGGSSAYTTSIERYLHHYDTTPKSNQTTSIIFFSYFIVFSLFLLYASWKLISNSKPTTI